MKEMSAVYVTMETVARGSYRCEPTAS